MKKTVLVISLGLALTACVTPSPYNTNNKTQETAKKTITLEEAKTKDYGTYPKNYKQLIKSYYENVLKDPYSVKYKEITKPKKTANAITGEYYYFVCATINAKNSYGGYTGWTTDTFNIKNGEILSSLPYVPVFQGQRLTRALDENRCHTQAEILILNP